MVKMIDRFLNLPRVYKRIISVFSDSMVLFFSIWAAFSLRLEQDLWVPGHGHILVAVLTVIFTILVFIRLGLYRAVVRYLSDKAFLTIVYGVFASSLALIVSGYLFQVLVPRSVPIIYGALAFIFVSSTRLGVRMLVNHPAQRNKEAVAIIGAGEKGMALASALRQGTEYKPALFVTFDRANHKSTIDGLPVVSIDLIAKNLSKYRIRRILLALDSDSKVDRKELLKQLESLEVPVPVSYTHLTLPTKRIV